MANLNQIADSGNSNTFTTQVKPLPTAKFRKILFRFFNFLGEQIFVIREIHLVRLNDYVDKLAAKYGE